MLAKRENLDILNDDQLIMILMKHSSIDKIPHVLFIPLGEIQHRLCIPLRRLTQTLPLGVLTDAFKDSPHRVGQFLDPIVGLFGS